MVLAEDKDAIMSKRTWTECAVVASLACLAGCTRAPQTVESSGGAYREVSTEAKMIAKARPPIPDMPVPIGFHLDEGRSRSFAAGGYRHVDHVYKGSGDKWAVAWFYKRQMPINRWELTTDLFAQGDIWLEFEKQTERCKIVITSGGLFNEVTVKVQLWTTGPIEPRVTGSGSGKGSSRK